MYALKQLNHKQKCKEVQREFVSVDLNVEQNVSGLDGRDIEYVETLRRPGNKPKKLGKSNADIYLTF